MPYTDSIVLKLRLDCGTEDVETLDCQYSNPICRAEASRQTALSVVIAISLLGFYQL